jgi:hypothetical protein
MSAQQQRTGEVIQELPNGDVVIDLAPVSTSLFVAILVPWALALALATFTLLELFDTRVSLPLIGLWFITPFWLAAAAYFIYEIARHRHARRVIRVEHGLLSYADATTGGSLTAVPASQCRICVRRGWWFRPWTVQIQAESDVSFWSRRGRSEPVVLLIDTNRAGLDQIAALLRRALQPQAR